MEGLLSTGPTPSSFFEGGLLKPWGPLRPWGQLMTDSIRSLWYLNSRFLVTPEHAHIVKYS